VRIFLTGGTGLIGSHVAERLRARGDPVVALVRPTSPRAHLDALGCALVEGDVADGADRLAPLMRGCDAVVHCAARVFERGGRQTFLRQNVDGTTAVLTAAAREAPRVVHLSSVAVYAGVRPDPLLTEEMWTRADPDRQAPYAASKYLSEAAAWRLHRAGTIRLTTVRPCVVYGERDRAAAPILIRYVGLPVVPLPAGGRARLPLVYAGNVAAGVVAALDRDVAIGRAYNLALDYPLTLRDVVEHLGRALGRRPRAVPVPAAPLRGLAAVLDGLARLVPGARRADVRRAVRMVVQDNPYDSSRARMELGWTNLITHHEGLRRTARWWRSKEDGR
jgi:2-alkyl-3-oxoalkanoate reductase